MEATAGVIAAEQVISTTIEGGAVAGVALAKPTLPLKATFTRFATTPESSSFDSLQRSQHSLSIIGTKAFIFGGALPSGKAAGNEIHIISIPQDNSGSVGYDYKCVPAVSVQDDESVPGARFSHTSVVYETKVLVYGGRNDDSVLNEHGRVWLFDVTSLKWTCMEPADESAYPAARYDHGAVLHNSILLIHGGTAADKTTLNDTWSFDLATRRWASMSSPKLSTPMSPPNFNLADGSLYLVDQTSDSSSTIHYLSLKDPEAAWKTLGSPITALAAGSRPGTGAGLVPTSTGMGRQYLLFILGDKSDTSLGSVDEEKPEASSWSGLWSLQLPSVAWSLAGAKDTTREKLGMGSFEASWADVEIKLAEESMAMEGKSHPGPRSRFASSAMDGKTVVLWGGINAKGDTEGDGWIVKIE